MNILDVCSELTFDSFVNIDYIGKGNIWINDTFDSYVGLLARSLLAEAIKNTAPGQLTVYGYDSSISGLFSTFSALSSVDPKFLKIIMNESELIGCLDYLSQHVLSVQNIIQDRYASLLEFRKDANSPIESYKLVVLNLDIAYIDKKTRVKLKNLLLNGPKCGVSFIIISPSPVLIEINSGKNISINPSMFDPNISVFETDGFSATIQNNGSERQVSWKPINPESAVRLCDEYIKEYQTTPLPTVSFLDLHKSERIWSRNSADGLTFSVGTYGTNSMEITIGEEKTQKHNAIVTGAVGQGKSNLISVIVHSLCMRYSPKELQLYLMDFKEGVSFKAFSNIDREEYLPHAKALGLECDPEFGLAVLEHLYSEYKNRMKILKERNVKSIKELREKYPDTEMPRIVCVIDEFQLMFEGRIGGEKIADLLEKSVRLFRASGIHFILASQSLCDNGSMAFSQKKSSLFAQVPIRIALKNTFDESRQTLSMNNEAAAYLRPREAIVNLDYGELSQNKKAVIAFADERLLAPIRRKMWEAASEYSTPPYVFESERRATVLNRLKEVKETFDSSNRLSATFGELLSVSGERITVPLTREFGRNIAIMGLPDEECNTAIGMIQNIALGLTAQKSNNRYIFCNFDESYDFSERYSKFIELMKAAGSSIELVEASAFEQLLSDLTLADGENDTFIFCLSLDNWKYEPDVMSAASPLKAFAEKSPSNGIHVIGWWQKISNFSSQIAGYGSPDSFNTRLILRVDEQQLRSITNPFINYSVQNNRALIYDSVEFTEEKKFIPYSPII